MTSPSSTFADLQRDLIHEDGPRISTMRNYRFCIVVYPPDSEFALRHEVQKLGSALEHSGWVVKIELQQLLFARLRALEGELEHLIAREKAVSTRDPERGLNLLEQKLTRELEAKSSDELIVPLDLGLKDREIWSAADIDALLDEIRKRLLEQLAKVRVRLD
jgi:hypothetical protein